MGSGIAAQVANAGINVVLLDLPSKEGDRNEIVNKAKERAQTSTSFSELIIGLPGETKESHFKSNGDLLDAGIDVRRGAMTREQAVQLVKMYDARAPEEYYDEYCEYYKMKKVDFLETIDKFANKNLFEKKIDGSLSLKLNDW